jgi:hypothetical protein
MGRTSIIALGVALMLLGWRLTTVELVPRSHAESIMMYLRERDVPVQGVHVTQQWPNALPFYAYGEQAMPYQASVSVQLLGGHHISGFMVCQSVPYDCRITVRDFQVFSASIPDIQSSQTAWEWVLWQWSKLITL